MKILIVDDEAPARIELRRLLSQCPEVSAVGEAASVGEALAVTEKLAPDVVLLDIRLGGQSGFDYIAAVGESPVRIIFVTAFDRYAVRAFECNALDYLLKPVAPERLRESLSRVPVAQPAAVATCEDDVVFVKAGSAVRFVPWSEIDCIRSNGNYTHLHLVDKTRPIVLRTLKQWLALAPVGHFVQVHRSAVVRQKAITQLCASGGRNHTVQLADGMEIAVGREYLGDLREAMRRSRA